MAKYDDRKNAALAVALRRQSSSPLDVSSVFNSIADFEAYVKQNTTYGPYSDAKENSFLQKINPYSYAGQVVTVLDAATGTAKTFVINKAGPLGTGTIDTNVERVDGAVGPHIRYNNGETNIDLAADTWYYSAYNKKYFKFGADGAYQITDNSPGADYNSANAIPDTVTEFQTTIGGKLQKFEFTEDIKSRYTEVGSVPAVDGKSIKAVDVVTADGKTVKTLEISSTTSTLADVESKKGTDDAYAAGTTFQLTLDLNGNVQWVKVDTQTMEGVAATLESYGKAISDINDNFSLYIGPNEKIDKNDPSTINTIAWRRDKVDPFIGNFKSNVVDFTGWRENKIDKIIGIQDFDANTQNTANYAASHNFIDWRKNTVTPFINNTSEWRGNIVDKFIGNFDANIKDFTGWRKNTVDPFITNTNLWINNTNTSLNSLTDSLSTLWGNVDVYSDALNNVRSSYLKDVAYNSSTGEFTFTKFSTNIQGHEQEVKIDLALERVVTNFFYTANGETPETGNYVYQNTTTGTIFISNSATAPTGSKAVKDSLVIELELEDNSPSYQAVNLSKLIDTYTVNNTNTITLNMTSGHEITANIATNAIDANNATVIFKDDALTTAFLNSKIADSAITNIVLNTIVANDAIDSAILKSKIADSAVTADVLNTIIAEGALTNNVFNKILADSVYSENLSVKNADYANDANYAEEANKARYADFAQDAEYANSANYASEASNASYAESANLAAYASEAGQAAFAENASSAGTAVHANYADNASHATSADSATSADFAENANYAQNAGFAQYADSATSADEANYAETAGHADTAGTATRAGSASSADKVVGTLHIGYYDVNGNFVHPNSCSEHYDGSSDVYLTIEDLHGITVENHATMEVFVSGNDASIVSDTGITTNDGEFLKDRKLTIEAGNFITLTTVDDDEDPAHKILKIDADAVHRSFTWQNTNGNAIAVVPEDDNCNIIFKEGDNVKFNVVSSYEHNANTTYPHNNPGSYTFEINAADTVTFGAAQYSANYQTEVNGPDKLAAIETYVVGQSNTLTPWSAASGFKPGDELYLDVRENGIQTYHIADEAITSNKIYEVDAGKITSNNSVRLVLNCGGARRA